MKYFCRMETTPVTENQNHENTDFLTSAILKEFNNETGSTTTVVQQSCLDYAHANGNQSSENNNFLSSKEVTQSSTNSTSKFLNFRHNGDPKSEKSSIQCDKESYIDYSVASKYLESLNARLETSLETEKLEDKHSYYEAGPSGSSEYDTDIFKRRKVEIFGVDEGPKIYHIKGNLVTPPIITKNLPEAFNTLPIYGKPGPNEDIDKFYTNKIREFVGGDLNDEQFENLAKFCSPDHLRTGKELQMTTPLPTLSVLSVFDHKEYDDEESKLCIVKKHRLRVANDPTNNYQKRLKYRGIRLLPINQVEDDSSEVPEADLEPGKDIVYHVRIYRPFPYNMKEKQVSCRHSVFSRDVILTGRQRLTALRDRVLCANDVSMRVDASAAPDELPATANKELFPSGFLFINNVFYVDARAGCADRSAGLRAWARARGLGHFRRRGLDTRLDDVSIRLGHPEVYVHQGNCEHLFTFSEMRLLRPEDPLALRQFPAHSAVSQHQSVYCTTCAEFGAKWVVTGCATVPFDPAYFCETCFKMYLYKDGNKIGDFKAYSYRGNEINMLKPSG